MQFKGGIADLHQDLAGSGKCHPAIGGGAHNLQAQPHPPGNDIALGDRISHFDVDQVLRRIRRESERTGHIDQQVVCP